MLTPATALALQRTIGNANVVRLARAPSGGDRAGAGDVAIEPLSPGMVEIETYTDIAQNYRLGGHVATNRTSRGWTSDREMVKRAQELIEPARPGGELHPGLGTSPFGQGWAASVREGLEEIRQMRRDIAYEKGAPKREAIAQAAAEAQRLSRSTRSSSRSCSTRRAPPSAPTTTR